jgi:hypothetical protein
MGDVMMLRRAEAAARGKSAAALERSRSLQAFERRVGQAIQAHYPTMAPVRWTARERGNARLFLEEVGREQAWRIIEYAIEHWRHLRQQRAFDWLGAAPTWKDLFNARQRLRAHLAEHDVELARRPSAKGQTSSRPDLLPETHPLEAASAAQRQQLDAAFALVRDGGIAAAAAAIRAARGLPAPPDVESPITPSGSVRPGEGDTYADDPVAPRS